MISPPPPPTSALCLALDRIRRAFFLFPQPLQPVGQFVPVNKAHAGTPGKLACGLGEGAGGDDPPLVGLVMRHACEGDLDRLIPYRSSPALQLNHHPLAVEVGKDYVHTLIAGERCLLYLVALLPEEVSHEPLEFRAAHVVDFVPNPIRVEHALDAAPLCCFPLQRFLLPLCLPLPHPLPTLFLCLQPRLLSAPNNEKMRMTKNVATTRTTAVP